MKGAGSLAFVDHTHEALAELNTRHLLAILKHARACSFVCECCHEIVYEEDREMAFKVDHLIARIKRILADRPHVQRCTRSRHVHRAPEKKRMRY